MQTYFYANGIFNNEANILGCEPIDGVLGVRSSNHINIAAFVLQMGYVCVSYLVEKVAIYF